MMTTVFLLMAEISRISSSWPVRPDHPDLGPARRWTSSPWLRCRCHDSHSLQVAAYRRSCSGCFEVALETGPGGQLLAPPAPDDRGYEQLQQAVRMYLPRPAQPCPVRDRLECERAVDAHRGHLGGGRQQEWPGRGMRT